MAMITIVVAEWIKNKLVNVSSNPSVYLDFANLCALNISTIRSAVKIVQPERYGN